MKGKILGVVLSITLCSNIFGIQVTNNTAYQAKIATKKSENDNNYNCDYIAPGKTKEVKVLNQEGNALIGFEKSNIYNFPAPEGNIIITEDDNNFIITEGVKKPVIMPKAGFNNLVLKEKPKTPKKDKSDDEDAATTKEKPKGNDESDDKHPKAKARFFTLKKMIIAGGVAAVVGYLVWNNYNKTPKTTTAK